MVATRPRDGLVRDRPPDPPAARARRPGGHLAGQRGDPADPLGGDRQRCAATGRVLQPLGDAQVGERDRP